MRYLRYTDTTNPQQLQDMLGKYGKTAEADRYQTRSTYVVVMRGEKKKNKDPSSKK